MTYLFCYLILLCTVQYTNGQEKNHEDRKTMSKDELHIAVDSSQLTFIHFLVSNGGDNEDIEYNNFLNTYYEASDYLLDFRINLSVVDCNTDYIPEYCGRNPQSLMTKVFVFRNGKSLTELATDTLFDINSVVSSALHLSLLQEVPIIQNRQELSLILQSSRAKQDVIFGKVIAIGTPEHRAFMEAAFAYGHRYKFLVTTSNANVLKPSDSELWHATRDGVWLYKCHQALLNEECSRIKYRGLLKTSEFPSFMKALDLPLIIKIEDGGNSLHRDLDMPTVVLLTKTKSFLEVDGLLRKTSVQYLGSVGFIIVDLDFVDTKKLPTLEGLNNYVERNTLPLIVMDPGGTDKTEFFEMDTELNVENLISFIDGVIGERIQANQNNEEDDEYDEDMEEVQDDPVQEATFHERSKFIDLIYTQVLTDKSYPDFIASKSVTAILFYVKWDPRCLAFREPFEIAAKKIIEIKSTSESLLRRVNCFDWPDVCSKANITRYPTIKIYKKSIEIDEYKGILDDFHFLKYFLQYTVSSPIILMTEEEGRNFMEGKSPSWGSIYLDAFTIGIFPGGTSKDRLVFNEVAKKVQGEYLMGSCVKDCAKALGNEIGGLESTVVTIKWEDVHQPEVVFNAPFMAEKLHDFLIESSEKIMPELTVVNLPSILKKKSALMMLYHGFDTYSDSAEKSLADIARDNSFPNVQICWLDASSSETIGHHLLKEYDIEVVRFRPTIVLLDFASKNLYHYGNSVDYRKSSFQSWMMGALNGEINEAAMLQKKQWKPLLAGYDFLSMIKEEEETENQMKNKASNSRIRKKPAEAMSEKDNVVLKGENEFNDLTVNEAQRHTEL